MFLIQSLIYEEIETNNNKGLSVPASTVVASFIRKCRFRPEVAAVQLMIGRQEDEASYRRSWGRDFRRRWLLSWGSVDKVPTMTASEVAGKVANPMKNIKSTTHNPHGQICLQIKKNTLDNDTLWPDADQAHQPQCDCEFGNVSARSESTCDGRSGCCSTCLRRDPM